MSNSLLGNYKNGVESENHNEVDWAADSGPMLVLQLSSSCLSTESISIAA